MSTTCYTEAAKPGQIVHNYQRRTPYTVKYNTGGLIAVRWVSSIQIAVAVLCIFLQAGAMGMVDFWNNAKSKFERTYDQFEVFVYFVTPDAVATGLWAGALMLINGAVGLSSWKYNRKKLIIAYVILSSLVIFSSFILIITSSVAVSELKRCREKGLSISIYGWSYRSYRHKSDTTTLSPIHFWDSNYKSYTTTTTTTQAPIFFLGEELTPESFQAHYYCTHPVFQFWVACDGMLVFSTGVMFILTLVSLIYSSKAACAGCCLCCGDEDKEMVSYHSVPQRQAMNLIDAPKLHQQHPSSIPASDQQHRYYHQQPFHPYMEQRTNPYSSQQPVMHAGQPHAMVFDQRPVIHSDQVPAAVHSDQVPAAVHSDQVHAEVHSDPSAKHAGQSSTAVVSHDDAVPQSPYALAPSAPPESP